MVSEIFHSLILLIVGVALVGVNVSKLYCNHCEEVYVQVEILPEENDGLCKHGCTCCQDAEEKPEHQHQDGEHLFYKVTDFSQIEKSIGLNLVFCRFEKKLLTESVMIILPEYEYFSRQEEYPDSSLSQEWLCTYRC